MEGRAEGRLVRLMATYKVDEAEELLLEESAHYRHFL